MPKRKGEFRLKSPDDIERIREAGAIIAGIFTALESLSLEGLTTLAIDQFVDDRILKAKARSSFKTIPTYNHATCISINHEVVHGIPSKNRKIAAGDIVKIDIGVVKNGYFADACTTFSAPPLSASAKRLIGITRESLTRAIAVMRVGNRVGDIGATIQTYVESNGYSVVRDFTGHGVGFAVHELPNVPHFGYGGRGPVLKEGMVLAVEPMINEGTADIVMLTDGWTAVTADGRLSAQFEHTIAITEHGPVLLTV